MGLFEKFGNIVNPDHNDDNYDNEYVFDGDDTGFNYEDDASRQAPASGAGNGMSLNSNSIELKVVKPERYDNSTAQKIADHLLNRRTVVLNLEAMNKEAATRLLDFLTGVAYSIDGSVQRVANNTFVIVPNNVDVSGEQLADQQKQRPTTSADLF